MQRARVIAMLGAITALGGCKASVPDGIFACDVDNDCPTGFVCRHEGEDQAKYCFDEGESDQDAGPPMVDPRKVDGGLDSGLDSGPTSGTGGASGSGGGGGEGGAGTGGDSGTAGTGGDTPTAPVPPTSTGFSTLGGRRTGGTLALFDDGFETGPRLCTGNKQTCVTGGFTP